VVVASGLDAAGFDPLARMMLHSEAYRAMAQMLLEVLVANVPSSRP